MRKITELYPTRKLSEVEGQRQRCVKGEAEGKRDGKLQGNREESKF